MLTSPYFEQLAFEEQVQMMTFKCPESYCVLVPQVTGPYLKKIEFTILFYIFFNLPHDTLQVEAYNEL